MYSRCKVSANLYLTVSCEKVAVLIWRLINSFPSFFIGSGLNDGEWHDVRFLAKENFAMLTIDGDEASAVRTTSPVQITTGSTYHFGGKFRNVQSPKWSTMRIDPQIFSLSLVHWPLIYKGL